MHGKQHQTGWPLLPSWAKIQLVNMKISSMLLREKDAMEVSRPTWNHRKNLCAGGKGFWWPWHKACAPTSRNNIHYVSLQTASSSTCKFLRTAACGCRRWSKRTGNAQVSLAPAGMRFLDHTSLPRGWSSCHQARKNGSKAWSRSRKCRSCGHPTCSWFTAIIDSRNAEVVDHSSLGSLK